MLLNGSPHSTLPSQPKHAILSHLGAAQPFCLVFLVQPWPSPHWLVLIHHTAKVVLLNLKSSHIPPSIQTSLPCPWTWLLMLPRIEAQVWTMICSLLPVWSHLLLVPCLTLLQPHWTPCYFSNTPGTLLPQGLCTTVPQHRLFFYTQRSKWPFPLAPTGVCTNVTLSVMPSLPYLKL